MFVARISPNRSLLLFTKELIYDAPKSFATSSQRLRSVQQNNLNTSSFHKNISIRTSNGTVARLVSAAAANSQHITDERSIVSLQDQLKPRPLTCLLTWLNAKERNIEKYRQLWMERGFDVLTVKMSASQLLLPNYGAIPLVRDFVKFLYSISSVYPDVLLHCFSVGAYQFGEMMAQLNDDEFLEEVTGDKSEDAKEMIQRVIKGIIFDSPVNLDGISRGVSRAMTDNAALCKTLETAIETHLKIARPVATVYYERASEFAHGYRTNAPGLLIVSEKDHIGAPEMSRKLMDAWVKNGIDVRMKVFKESGHVQHFHKYPEEYRQEVDKFLQKVRLTARN